MDLGRLCIYCEQNLLGFAIFIEEEEAYFCNNPKCPRVGLLTVITAIKEEAKEDDEGDKHKGV